MVHGGEGGPILDLLGPEMGVQEFGAHLGLLHHVGGDRLAPGVLGASGTGGQLLLGSVVRDLLEAAIETGPLDATVLLEPLAAHTAELGCEGAHLVPDVLRRPEGELVQVCFLLGRGPSPGEIGHTIPTRTSRGGASSEMGVASPPFPKKPTSARGSPVRRSPRRPGRPRRPPCTPSCAPRWR